jgi:ABC-2 type transport system permease protein
MTSSPSVAAALGRLGVRSLTAGYLGMVFLILAVVIAALAASQVASLRSEEASGRLDGLLVRPVGRTAWLAGRLIVAAGLILAAGGAIGLFAWLGARSQHVGVALPKMLEAGINATVPALVVLGVGALVFGLRPRLSAPAAYGLVVWSFLVDLLGSMIRGSDWLRDSSLFSHMALAPAASPTWGTSALMLLIGLAAAAIGAIGFERRDVEYE